MQLSLKKARIKVLIYAICIHIANMDGTLEFVHFAAIFRLNRVAKMSICIDH
jgi:hypothetical protein